MKYIHELTLGIFILASFLSIIIYNWFVGAPLLEVILN